MAFDRQIAALTVFCEASGASAAEQSAVAHVIMNRVKDGRFGRTVASVCLRRFQFSEFNDDAGDNANLLRGAEASESDPVMVGCMTAVAGAFADWPDPTKGATHYHDKSIAPPAWTVGATLTLETAKFRFYSNVK